METKVNNFKTMENLRKTQLFIKKQNFYRKMLLSRRKLYFSIEILIFYTKNCVFLRFFYGFKIIQFNFHLPYRAVSTLGVYIGLIQSGSAGWGGMATLDVSDLWISRCS